MLMPLPLRYILRYIYVKIPILSLLVKNLRIFTYLSNQAILFKCLCFLEFLRIIAYTCYQIFFKRV